MERLCPNCKKSIFLKDKRDFIEAEKLNRLCQSCSIKKGIRKDKKYFRTCPECKTEIGYSSETSYNKACKLNLICHSCGCKKFQNEPLHKEQMAKWKKARYLGSGNPFYGKVHTQETLDKIRANRDESFYKTKEFKEKISKVTSGKNNPMYGRRYYDIWVEKYGKEEADRRQLEKNKKTSIASSGKRNGMYGKPSPVGSGNGWSGWYKNTYFRSLKELSYIIYVLEATNSIWKSAESGFKIKYLDMNGTQRTYHPDFFVNNKYLIEIKPEKMMNTPNNIYKKEAAEKFCKLNNLEYRMVDIKTIKEDEVIKLYNLGLIVFTKKYTERIIKICQKTK